MKTPCIQYTFTVSSSEDRHILDIADPGKAGLISNHEAFLPPYPIIKFSLSPETTSFSFFRF